MIIIKLEEKRSGEVKEGVGSRRSVSFSSFPLRPPSDQQFLEKQTDDLLLHL